MRLSELLRGPREGQGVTTGGTATGGVTTGSESEIEIRGLSANSRKIEPGFLFAALPGSKADGRGFIAEAAAKGAVAVLAPAGTAVAARHRACRRCESAPPPGPDGGPLLRPPAAHRRRGHRHQRQDLHRRIHAPDLAAARPAGREPGHAGPRRAGRAANISPSPRWIRSISIGASRGWPIPASIIWRWRPPPTASTSSASTG